MPTERIIGIDFGTSTSVIRVKRYKDGEPLVDKLHTQAVTFNMGSTMLPTLIRKIENGTYYGYEAQIPKKNSTLYQNFKIKLESDNSKEKAQARELTKEFFKYMASVYKEQSAGGHLGESTDVEKTLISYPVKWTDETKKFMLQTAKESGFPNVEGLDEAQAAIHAAIVQNEESLQKNGYLQNGKPVNIMLIDMGAGTTDIVISEYTPGASATNRVLCTWPKDGDVLFGGREVDELLLDYIKEILPEDEAERICKKCSTDAFKEWKDTMVSPGLKRSETIAEFSALDNITEMLDIELEYAIDRSEFEKTTEAYLQKLPLLVKGSLTEAKLKGSDIDLVILTGGHSQWYFVKDILIGVSTKFGMCGLDKIKTDHNRVISISLPQETVALGMVYNQIAGDFIIDDRGNGSDILDDIHAETKETLCKNCGKALQSDVKFCPHCGQPVYNDDGKEDSIIQKSSTPMPQKKEKGIYSYGDLVEEFITKVKKPPVENGIYGLPEDFIRQLREYNGLNFNEKIIYTYKMGYSGCAQYRNPAFRFLFTESYFVVPRYNMMGIPERWRNILWSDFININIDQTSIPLFNFITFDGKKVFVIYNSEGTQTNSRVASWRYFYMDLQEYLRDNAYRIHK